MIRRRKKAEEKKERKMKKRRQKRRQRRGKREEEEKEEKEGERGKMKGGGRRAHLGSSPAVHCVDDAIQKGHINGNCKVQDGFHLDLNKREGVGNIRKS